MTMMIWLKKVIRSAISIGSKLIVVAFDGTYYAVDDLAVVLKRAGPRTKRMRQRKRDR